jgi:hypothetical protein
VLANASSYTPDISADGHNVTFGTDATNLVAPDVNAHTDVVAVHTQTGTALAGMIEHV